MRKYTLLISVLFIAFVTTFNYGGCGGGGGKGGSSYVPPPPTLSLSRTTVEFSIFEGQVDLPPGQMAVLSANGSLSWSATTPNVNWLSVSNKAPNTLINGNLTSTTKSTFSIVLTSNVSSLASNIYTTTMQITSAGAGNSPITLTIQLTVSPPPATMPAIGVSAGTFNFSAPASGPNPTNQNLTISNIGGGSLTWEAETSSNWLTLSSYQGTAPNTIQVSIDIVTYAVPTGTYTGWIKVWGVNLTDGEIPLLNPVVVRVNLTITGSVTEPPGRDWTILVYMNADNDLEKFGIDDINEMEAITSTYDPSEVTVIVLCDRWAPLASNPKYDSDDTRDGNWTNARAYLIQNDANPDVINSTQLNIPGITGVEVDMGVSATLTSFINYGVTNYPAANYGLVVWNHGMGWQSTGHDEDNGAGGEGNLAGPALLEGIGTAGQYFDVVIFDECLDANFELFYEIADWCSWIVATEETAPGKGGAYTPWLDYLASNSASSIMEPLVLAQKFSTTYFDQYASGDDADPTVTTSVIDPDVLSNTLKAQVNTLATYLQTNINSLLGVAAQSKDYAEVFTGDDYRDLGDFVYLLYQLTTDPTLQTNAANVYNGVQQSVFYRDSYEGHPYALGIQVTLPEIDNWDTISADYTTTLYGSEPTSTWADFLDAFYNAFSLDTTDPVVSIVSQTSTPTSYTAPGEYVFNVTELNPVNATLYVGQVQGNALVLLDNIGTAPDWTLRIQGPSVIPDWSTTQITEVWDTLASAVTDGSSIAFAYAEYDDPVSPEVAKVNAIISGTILVTLNFDVDSGKLTGVYPAGEGEPQGEIQLKTGDLIDIQTISIDLTTGDAVYVNVVTFTYDETVGLSFGWDTVPDGGYSLMLGVEDASGNTGVSTPLISANVLNQ